MKKIVILSVLCIGLLSMGSCISKKSYAQQHVGKQFTSWEDIGKKMDACEKQKPKDHAKVNKWWKF